MREVPTPSRGPKSSAIFDSTALPVQPDKRLQPRVLAQTRSLAERQGLRVQLIDWLRDVDTSDDLRAVRARRTSAWLADKSWAARRINPGAY